MRQPYLGAAWQTHTQDGAHDMERLAPTYALLVSVLAHDLPSAVYPCTCSIRLDVLGTRCREWGLG